MTRVNAQGITAVQNTITALADLYPACFAVFQERRKPLKVGVRDDVIAALNGAITDKEVSLALRWYCGDSGYLKACTEGTERIGLDGKASGQVTREEADNARARLAQRRQANGSCPHPIARAVSVDTTPIKPRLSLADLRKAAQARRQHSGA
jgi:sRNA-binding protein